jgi:hypothetical protein
MNQQIGPNLGKEKAGAACRADRFESWRPSQ